METKVIQIDGSLGILLPKETVRHLNMREGDVLHVVESPDGFRVTSSNAVSQARAIMKKRQAVLKELAK